MSEPDYSWIKPGVLAVIDRQGGDNDGAVVRCLSVPYFFHATCLKEGRVLWANLVEIEAVTPLSMPSISLGHRLCVEADSLRPLDFPKEADIQEISRDMEIVE